MFCLNFKTLTYIVYTTGYKFQPNQKVHVKLHVVFKKPLNHSIHIFLKISSLVDGKVLASCTSHTDAWVTDVVFGRNCKQLVTVGNNIQVGFALYYS